jgi:peptidyl-tRNA hydrolase
MSDQFEYKQVIVFRTDLQMGKGKMRASRPRSHQRSPRRYVHHKKWWDAWLFEGQKKVALKVPDREGTLRIGRSSRRLGAATCTYR